MRSCRKLSELFSDYVEKTLAAADRHAVETHLQLCLPCQQSVTRLASLRQALQTLPGIKTSPDFDTVLRTRMRLEKRRLRPLFAPPISKVRTLAWGSLATALVIGSAYVLLRQSSVDSRPQHPGYPSPFTSLIPAPTGSASSATLTNPAQLFYTLDGYTIRQEGGGPLRISSAGAAQHETSVADSTPPGRADLPELTPSLISF